METLRHGDKGLDGEGPTKRKGQRGRLGDGNGYIREVMPDAELLLIPVLFSNPLCPNPLADGLSKGTQGQTVPVPITCTCSMGEMQGQVFMAKAIVCQLPVEQL